MSPAREVQRAADASWLLVESATCAPRPIAQSPSAVAAAISARVERMEPHLLAAATEGVCPVAPFLQAQHRSLKFSLPSQFYSFFVFSASGRRNTGLGNATNNSYFEIVLPFNG